MAIWTICPECDSCYNASMNPSFTVDEICAQCAGFVQCNHCRDWIDPDNAIDDMCEECAIDEGWCKCEHCNTWLNPDSQYIGADNNNYCDSCFYREFDHCSVCGESCWHDDLCVDHGNRVCNSCYEPNGEWEAINFKGRHIYNEMPSRRKYGVEIETSECDNYDELEGRGSWGAKPDSSISGMEFVSGIFYGDDGLTSIRDLCAFANNNSWEVDRRCGLHIHFDVTNETDDSRKAIALAYLLTYDVWSSFVDDRRCANVYCHKHRIESEDVYKITNWRNWADQRDRYEWINFNAYSRHQTFEIRLHYGSIDAIEICNWIKAHATFMDWAVSVGWHKVRCTLLCKDRDEKFEFITQVWQNAGCNNLRDYYNYRAHNCYKKFKTYEFATV